MDESLSEQIERLWNNCDRKLKEFTDENEAMREWLMANMEARD